MGARTRTKCVQSNLSGTTTLDAREKWSFQTSGRSRQVLFAWNLIVDRNVHKLENGLSRQGGLPEGVVPDRFYCIPKTSENGWKSGQNR